MIVDDCQDLPGPKDPLMIDLGQDGIHLGEKGVGVLFDFEGKGDFSYGQWVAAQGNDAFVTADFNHNGIVDDGTELFGDLNVLPTFSGLNHAKRNVANTVAKPNNIPANGFATLAHYDRLDQGGNNDGFITDADAIWSDLTLWLDINADGISSVNEIQSLTAFGITTLDVTPKVNNRRDAANNLIPFWSWATNDQSRGNNKYKMVDVYFQQLSGTPTYY